MVNVPNAEALRRAAHLCDRERYSAERALTLLVSRSTEEDVKLGSLLEEAISDLRDVAQWLRRQAGE